MKPALRRRLVLRFQRAVTRAWASTHLFERLHGRGWYPTEHRWCVNLARRSGHPISTVCGIYAALSPNNGWMANRLGVELAVIGLVWLASGYPRDKHKAERILAGEDPETVLRGPKTTAFYRLLRDAGRNDIDVCVDGHIANLARGEYRVLKTIKLSKSEAAAIAEGIRRAAYSLGERPCHVQAALWSAWRDSRGFQQTRLSL